MNKPIEEYYNEAYQGRKAAIVAQSINDLEKNMYGENTEIYEIRYLRRRRMATLETIRLLRKPLKTKKSLSLIKRALDRVHLMYMERIPEDIETKIRTILNSKHDRRIKILKLNRLYKNLKSKQLDYFN